MPLAFDRPLPLGKGLGDGVPLILMNLNRTCSGLLKIIQKRVKSQSKPADSPPQPLPFGLPYAHIFLEHALAD